MAIELATAAASQALRTRAATPRGLAAFGDAHRGETLIVCGCGPSLRELVLHDDMISVGVNDVGRLFDPTYLVVVNPRAQFKNDRFKYVERSNARALFTQLDLGNVSAPIVRFRLGRYGGVDPDGDALHYTQNSPYVAVCLAAHMGATRIGLIGVDFTDDHFFARTGRHPLAGRLREIDAQYARLAKAMQARGIELVNLSAASRLSSVPKMSQSEFAGRRTSGTGSAPASKSEKKLRIVSYATTPVAGVPELLARCISTHTAHHATCLWASGDYGNGVRFAGGVTWNREPARALKILDEADVVVVHNGKVAPQHRAVLERKAVITMAHNYAWNVDCKFVERGFPGVVVGQYQATLPEFAAWQSVPNPLPLQDGHFMPEPKGDAIRICYTPSGAHEAYPSGHRLYWHAKGFQTTTRILDELTRSHGVLVETTRGRQVSHEESLAMKRRAHIVIDECVTGSYHRNSLEGLAAGCVVVNGVGIVPTIADVLRQCSGPEACNPFVFAPLANLRAQLIGLIERGPLALAEQGAANRQWMERHWDFASQWTRFWQPAVQLAQQRALNLPVSSNKRGVPASRIKGAVMPTSIARAPVLSDPTVSIVIPHGGSDRLAQLTATLVKLRQSPAVCEILIVDMGRSRSAEEIASRWRCRYQFVHHEGPFERARALNIGSAMAKGDLVLWLDNDLLIPPGFVEAAARELSQRRLDCLLPFTSIRYLNSQDTDRIVRAELDPQDCRAVNTLYSGRAPSASGGAGLVRREFITRFGGLIEGFRGWGGEDNAWRHKVSLLGSFGVTQRTDQHLSHLYHDGSGGYQPTGPCKTNPHYRDNVALMERVCSIRDRTRFLECFPPSAPQLPATAATANDETAIAAPDSAIPSVWLYWEGPCPAWVRACHRTILRHIPTAKVLDAAAFDRLRMHDRDIRLSHLQAPQRADFVRAYLLAHHGGLWIDSDCLVMQPLTELLRQLDSCEFIAHRERSGLVSNGFIAARPGSPLAGDYYRQVCKILRARKPIGWTTLGSEALGAALNGAQGRWLELPCERIQPVCWTKPESFVECSPDAEHEQRFDSRALCYMLSHSQISQRKLGEKLLQPDSFFSFLLRRSTGCVDDSAPDYERIFSAMGELYRRYGDESLSGPGSTLAQTRILRERLPQLLEHLKVRSLLDAPCGDFNWMKTVNLGLDRYVGVDALPDLIARNQQMHANEQRQFQCMNILSGKLPQADAILSRDFLVHLSFDEALRCLASFRESGAQYLLATTFPQRTSNADTRDGEWRTLNLTLAPFNFPAPLHLINEKCTEGGGAYADKSLGVWRLPGIHQEQHHGNQKNEDRQYREQ